MNMINMQIITGRWQEVSGKLRERWGQLTDNDLTEFHGDADQLIGLIHRKTGEGYEAVDKFLCDLSHNGASTVGAVADTVREYAGHAAKTVRDNTKQAADQVHAGYIEAKRLVRDQPLRSLAAFFGLGLITGLMFVLFRNSK
jgi:uncharacterized protein YjbJ (UPF0337 family)